MCLLTSIIIKKYNPRPPPPPKVSTIVCIILEQQNSPGTQGYTFLMIKITQQRLDLNEKNGIIKDHIFRFNEIKLKFTPKLSSK